MLKADRLYYKDIIRNLSFDVSNGEVTLFTGKNGSGKTTLLKILLGFICQDSGHIEIDGVSNIEYRKKYIIGYLPEFFLPIPFLTVKGFLLFYKRIAGSLNEEIDDIISLLHLEDLLKKKCAVLSRGEIQKLGIAVCLIGNPNILFFDEPETGLDTSVQEVFLKLINSLKKKNKSLIIVSHDKAVINKADRVFYLQNREVLEE